MISSLLPFCYDPIVLLFPMALVFLRASGGFYTHASLNTVAKAASAQHLWGPLIIQFMPGLRQNALASLQAHAAQEMGCPSSGVR